MGEVDSDGTYPAKLSSCSCSNRLALTKKGVLKCPGCGQETIIESEKEDKLKSKHGKKGKSNSFIYSQNSKKKEPMSLYEEECKIAGGDITSYDTKSFIYLSIYLISSLPIYPVT